MCRTITLWIIRAMLASLLLGAQVVSLSAAAAESASDAVGDALILEVRTGKERAYVHEPVPVTVTLLAGSLAIRNIQYPRLAGDAFTTTDFASPRQTRVSRDGREYTAYEFSATLVASRSGTIEVGPAEIHCDLLAPSSAAAAVFGDNEAQALSIRSQPLRVAILPLPSKGQPVGYSGAVGRFTLTREATPSVIDDGDPVTLKTRIEGVGNVDRFSCPAVAVAGVRSYPPRAQQTASQLLCEQVLVPEVATPFEIPATVVSFFDPRRQRYQTLTSAPIQIAVSAVTGTASAAQPAAAADPTRAQSDQPPFATQRLLTVVTLGAMPLLPLFFLAMRRRAGPQVEQSAVAEITQPTVADWLADAERAFAANDPTAFATAVFRTLQADLGERHGLPATAITEDVLNRVLRPAGVAEGRLRAYADLFRSCDRLRYAPRGVGDRPMQETLCHLHEVLGQD